MNKETSPKMFDKEIKVEGTPNSPVLIFSNSLGADYSMWDALVPLLVPFFRVLRHDTSPDAYRVEELGQQVIDLMEQLGVETAYFCGLSKGGLVGQWLGINYPRRFKKIVLSNTAAKIGTIETWNARIDAVKTQGLEAIVEATMERWFTDRFRQTNPQKVAQIRQMFLKTDLQAYINGCYAVRDADFREQLQNLAVETLVITGEEDPVTNVEQARFLASHISNAQLKILPARHLAATELPKEYAEVLIDFLLPSTPKGAIHNRGMMVRRTVLGDAHVDNAIANINEFNVDFQDFITRYAWGEIWTRPNLSKHNRSLITLAMLIALNRSKEFKMHVKAALNNGVTIEEIKEVIMQAAIYCGLPAANEAFHAAEEVLKDAYI